MDGINRIKILASEVKDKAVLKIVDYLISRVDMDEKYLNEEKSLKEMISYIKEEAKKQSNDGVAMIEDVEVYNWVIHYFDESNEDLKLIKTRENIISNIPEKEDNKKTKPKQISKVSNNKKWVSEGQLSLFD